MARLFPILLAVLSASSAEAQNVDTGGHDRELLEKIVPKLEMIIPPQESIAQFLVQLKRFADLPGPLREDKVVLIVREDDAGSIADQLERSDVIDSAIWFNILTLLEGNRSALKRGEYAFKAAVSMNEIENELIAHHVVRYKLTIPEGLTSEQVVDRLREDPVLIGEIREIPRDGSLMPDTYYFERGDTRQDLLARMAQLKTNATSALRSDTPSPSDLQRVGVACKALIAISTPKIGIDGLEHSTITCLNGFSGAMTLKDGMWSLDSKH